MAEELKKGDRVTIDGLAGKIVSVHEGGHLVDVELEDGRATTQHTSNVKKGKPAKE